MRRRKAALVALIVLLVPTTAQADAKPGDTGQATVEVQYLLRSFGYVLPADGVYGAKTAKAVRHFQKANGLLVDSVAGPITMAALGGAPAVRQDPVAGLSGCGLMMHYARKHGLPDEFLALGKRESNCRNDVTSSTGCCFGFWQHFFTSHMRSPGYLPGIKACGIDSLDDIYGDNPRAMDGQACMTAVLHEYHRVNGPYALWPWRL